MLFRQMIEYLHSDWGTYLGYVAEHVVLSLEALLIAVLAGVAGGYLCYRHGALKKYVFFAAQGFRVIPSLAVLFILIPFSGVGRVPALIALALLAIPPILVNTCLGFEEVPQVLVETARGIGMDQMTAMGRVILPLAIPYLLTGLKLALIKIIASATLAAYIGAGGLGSLILTGLGLYRMDLLVLGGGSVAALSLLTMVIFELLIPKKVY